MNITIRFYRFSKTLRMGFHLLNQSRNMAADFCLISLHWRDFSLMFHFPPVPIAAFVLLMSVVQQKQILTIWCGLLNVWEKMGRWNKLKLKILRNCKLSMVPLSKRMNQTYAVYACVTISVVFIRADDWIRIISPEDGATAEFCYSGKGVPLKKDSGECFL